MAAFPGRFETLGNGDKIFIWAFSFLPPFTNSLTLSPFLALTCSQNDLSHLVQYRPPLPTVASGYRIYTQKGGTSQLDSNRLPWRHFCLK